MRSRLAWGLWALGISGVVVAAAFGIADRRGAQWNGFTQVVAFFAVGTVGLVVARHQPKNPLGWIYLARDRNVNWLIIKQDLQDEDEGIEKQRDDLTEALEHEFEQVESLKGYDIYKRGQPDDDSPDEK